MEKMQLDCPNFDLGLLSKIPEGPKNWMVAEPVVINFIKEIEYMLVQMILATEKFAVDFITDTAICHDETTLGGTLHLREETDVHELARQLLGVSFSLKL